MKIIFIYDICMKKYYKYHIGKYSFPHYHKT